MADESDKNQEISALFDEEGKRTLYDYFRLIADWNAVACGRCSPGVWKPNCERKPNETPDKH